MVPQYFINGGLRLDYERRIGKGEIWLIVAPQYYLDKNQNYYDYYYSSYRPQDRYRYYDKLKGVGLNLYVKWNAKKSQKLDRLSGKPARLFYLAAGPAYQHYNLSTYEEVPVPYEENGTTYYRFDYKEVKYKAIRYGGSVLCGMQFAMDPFLLDLYLGFGYRRTVDENGEKIVEGHAVMIDPFYSGMILDGGFKFGVYF